MTTRIDKTKIHQTSFSSKEKKTLPTLSHTMTPASSSQPAFIPQKIRDEAKEKAKHDPVAQHMMMKAGQANETQQPKMEVRDGKLYIDGTNAKEKYDIAEHNGIVYVRRQVVDPDDPTRTTILSDKTYTFENVTKGVVFNSGAGHDDVVSSVSGEYSGSGIDHYQITASNSTIDASNNKAAFIQVSGDKNIIKDSPGQDVIYAGGDHNIVPHHGNDQTLDLPPGSLEALDAAPRKPQIRAIVMAQILGSPGEGEAQEHARTI
jgi:hypothetical protein